jgi:type I restriction enzyme S subunit
MTINTKPRLTPKLRFPEFQDGEGWAPVSLGALAALRKGEQLDASDKDERGRYPHYNGGISPSSSTHKANKEANTIIISEGGNSCGYVQFITQPFWCGGHCYAVEAKKQVSTLCLFFALQAKQRKIMALRIGSGLPNIQKSTLIKFQLSIPDLLPEQHKIASCLSSLDDLIAAERQKLDALKAHKQGLMQQLFPREGETRPRIRFPEFRNAGEWEEKQLGDLCERIMDGTHFSPKTKSGPRPYLTSKNIQNGRIDLSNLSHISEEEHRQIYARCPVKLHDVLLTKDGANTGNCAINVLDYEFSLLSSVAVLRGSKNRIDQQFLFFSLLSDRTQTLITESMSGQAITRITLEKIGNFLLAATSMDEQHRIASCLSSLDDLIAAQGNKLDALKTHKKGLMQQLFPSEEPDK